MKIQEEIQFQQITEEFENEARELVLKGLEERFGFIDTSYNPDLRNIIQSYTHEGAVFLVGIYDRRVVCSGAISFETPNVGRVGRMSVLKEYRRAGVAKRMIHCLESWAIQYGYQQLVLETNNEWHNAIEFYKGRGYTLSFDDGKCSHFVKDLL